MAAAVLATLPVLPVVAPQGRQQTLFDFHSAFWMNLHTYLHALGRPNAPLDESLPSSAGAEAARQWRDAIDTYRARYARQSLIFDPDMVRTTEEIAAAESSSLAGAKIDAGHRQLLESVAPVYRAHFWSAHDAANQRFSAALQPLVAKHGEAIAARLARSLDASWPSRPVRVDIVHNAGPPGNAHTVSETAQITIAATDPRHQGLNGLEVLFHEASHIWDAVLMKGVEDAAKQLGRRPPGQLWHGLLFFNAGVITRDALDAVGIRDYELYMEQQDMFDRVYRGWRPGMEEHWLQFLNGKLRREEAILRILRDGPP
jgi:hypothetical protein